MSSSQNIQNKGLHKNTLTHSPALTQTYTIGKHRLYIRIYRKRKHIKHIRETISQYTNHTNKNVNNWTNHYIHCQYGNEKKQSKQTKETQNLTNTRPPGPVMSKSKFRETNLCAALYSHAANLLQFYPSADLHNRTIEHRSIGRVGGATIITSKTI